MKLSVIILFFVQTVSFGQILSDSLLISFYNKTLSTYFTDSLIKTDQKKYNNLIIQTDLDSSKLIKNISLYKILYYSATDNIDSILVKLGRKSNNRITYSIAHFNGGDTPGLFEIHINKYQIKYLNKSKADLFKVSDSRKAFRPASIVSYNHLSGLWTLRLNSE